MTDDRIAHILASMPYRREVTAADIRNRAGVSIQSVTAAIAHLKREGLIVSKGEVNSTAIWERVRLLDGEAAA